MTADLEAKGHRNLLEFCREQTRWSDRGIAHEEGGVLCLAGDSEFVMANAAYRVDPATPGEAVVAQARRFFHDLGRPFFFQLHDRDETDVMAACEAAGIHRVFDAPEMICAAPVPPTATPPDVELRVVTDVEGIADFVAVIGEAYTSLGMPAEVIPDVINRFDRVLDSGNVHTVVAYLDGEPMAGAQTLVREGMAGVYWVGTREAGRGRGLGELVTTAVTNAGFELGGVANSLQASRMGEPIYRRMGYDEVYRYVTYLDSGPRTTETR